MGGVVMTIWMVTGLHDARWLTNTVANFERQTYAKKRLIVVENGPGAGCSRNLPVGTIVLTSEPGPAHPLNASLAWLRANASPDDWFCKCDSDDYYGPGYLDSFAQAATSGADYAGRASLYIRTTEGRLWYVEGEANGDLFHGPTLVARISTALDFPVVERWGEDERWCRLMRDAGMRPCTIAPENFCYQRWSSYDHTWPCTDHELRTSWDAPFIDLGDVNLDVVNGVIPRPAGKELPVPSISVHDLMPVRVLKEEMRQRMKIITIPKHTIPSLPKDAEPAGFSWFVTWLLNSDREFNTDGVSIRSAMRIENALKDAGHEVKLDEQDWERLKRAAESPSQGGYPVQPARGALPWIDAILSAK